jgi:hypothetical protein
MVGSLCEPHVVKPLQAPPLQAQPAAFEQALADKGAQDGLSMPLQPSGTSQVRTEQPGAVHCEAGRP